MWMEELTFSEIMSSSGKLNGHGEEEEKPTSEQQSTRKQKRTCIKLLDGNCRKVLEEEMTRVPCNLGYKIVTRKVGALASEGQQDAE